MKHHAIGIDVGGTKIWAALGSREGEILAERKADTPSGAVAFVHALDRIIEAVLRESGIAPEALSGIGIGLPGLVSRDSRTVDWVPNLPALNREPLVEKLETRWRLIVRLENDARLALSGESWLGAAKGCKNAIMLTLGTGVGGAIMVEGRLYKGSRGTAGSMGWMTLDRKDRGDGESGWLERTASGSAINRRAALLPARLDSNGLFGAAYQGDTDALALVHEIGDELGTSIAALVSILDPEMVVIGGGVAAHLDLLLPTIEKAMLEHASPTTRATPVRASTLHGRGGVLGALLLAFDAESRE